VDIYFVTHTTSVDNEAGIASGHRDPGLSPRGRAEAAALPARLTGATFGAVFSSSLRRSIETARIAFGEKYHIRRDARLNEIDYGDYTGTSLQEIDAVRSKYVDVPFPNGESYRQRVALVDAFLAQVRQEGLYGALVIVGHRATKWSLDILLDQKELSEVVKRRFFWRPYWQYRLE
jgi:broad specificity phosphatase PhoE